MSPPTRRVRTCHKNSMPCPALTARLGHRFRRDRGRFLAEREEEPEVYAEDQDCVHGMERTDPASPAGQEHLHERQDRHQDPEVARRRMNTPWDREPREP